METVDYAETDFRDVMNDSKHDYEKESFEGYSKQEFNNEGELVDSEEDFAEEEFDDDFAMDESND